MNQFYNNSGDLVHNWYAAGLGSEIRQNVPVRVTIFQVPIVLWRNSDNTIVALVDRCNHRNAPLSEGKIIDNCLVCPYHGWTYDESGQCVNIPSEGPHTERIPNKKVEKFPVIEEHGLVWIWMGRDSTPDCAPFPMPTMKEKGWNHYYMTTDFESNVTDLVENFMDVPHTVYVHKGWFRDRKQICIKATVERTEDSVLVSYDQSGDAIGFSDKLLNPKGLPMKHTDNFYMPNNTKVDYIYGEEERGFIITSTCTPIKDFSSRVYTLISYKFGWLTPLAKLGLKWYTKIVINQDVEIMNLQGKNLQAYGSKNFKSTQSDTMHIFIETLRQSAKKNASPPPGRSKDIEFWV